MSTLFLLVPDAALREAVVEQIMAAKLEAARVVDTPQALLKQVEAEGDKDCVAIVDAATYDAVLRAPSRPVILLLGDAEDADAVTESFDKPFRLGHLIARLRYYLETAPLLRDRVVTFGNYRLEPQNRCVIGKDGEVIRLTEKETALLSYLARSSQSVTRRDILAEVWGYDERIDTHTLETHLYQLRRKFDKDGRDDHWLVFEAGVYRLAREGE
jgi:DNA-binding response OmpR family regulator